MRTVLVTVMQNFLFLPHRWPKPLPVLIVPTHGGMARLSWPRWLVTHLGGLPAQKTITHPSIDWAGCKVTSLIETNMLPLNHATTYMHTGCHKKTEALLTASPKSATILLPLTVSNAERFLKKFFCPETYNTTVLRPFFRDYPGEPVPEDIFFLLYFYGAREDIRGRHTDHLAGRHTIQTN